jgi:hypothetical protein
MRDILPINRLMQENKIAQDVLGTIFSRGVATLVSPLFDHAYPRRCLSPFNVIAKFRAVEDGVDADVLWTQRTRPQDLENCTNRRCVQRRLARSVGVRPTEVVVRRLVAWVAGRKEIEFLKPTDKAIYGMVSESSGRNNRERKVTSKCADPRGRAYMRWVKAA